MSGLGQQDQLTKRHVQLAASATPGQNMRTDSDQLTMQNDRSKVTDESSFLSLSFCYWAGQGHQDQADRPYVLVPSAIAWNVLLAVPLLLWTLITVTGISHFRSLPSRKAEVEHFMEDFDMMFRRVGPLLPLLPWLLRLVALEAGSTTWQAPPPPGSRRRAHPTALAKGTMNWACLAIYVVASVARVLLYLGHRAVQHVAVQNGTTNVLLSDHVLLGASVVACLHVELLCSVSDLVKLELVGAGLLRQAVAATSLVLSALLYCFVGMDMYFTCRYYHHPYESASGVAAGLLLFQAPVMMWFLRMAQPRQQQH